MKKQNFILWVSSLFIVFLIGYIRSVSNPNFPVSGTTGMDAKKITYVFEKKTHIKDTLTLRVRTDINTLSGKVTVYGNMHDTAFIPFVSSEKGELLTAYIPVKQLPAKVSYSVALMYKDSVFSIPAGNTVLTTFCYPKIPMSIMSVYYFFLYFGLLLAVRIGLEFFSDGSKVKKFSLFTLICFSLYGFFIIPVINFIESNAMNRTILQPEKMFTIPSLAFCALWIIAVITFFSKCNKPWQRWFFAAATLIIFFFNGIV